MHTTPPLEQPLHSVLRMSKVSYERVGAAAVLTITRPERRNAVDDETAEELLDGFHRFEADDGARALVLTGGRPEAFCAGADLKAFAERAEAFLEGASPRARGGHRRVARSAPRRAARVHPPAASKPTIAAISGWAWRVASSSRSGATCGWRPRTLGWGSPSAASASR